MESKTRVYRRDVLVHSKSPLIKVMTKAQVVGGGRGSGQRTGGGIHSMSPLVKAITVHAIQHNAYRT